MKIYEKLRNELKKRHLRITSQREAVLSVFLENQGEHLTADEVYEKLSHKNSHISKATIYRTVDLLKEMGFLSKVNFGDGMERYEVKEPNSHQHHHLICTKCGRIYEIKEDLLEELEKLIEEKTGFKIVDHQLNFYGICPRCQALSEEKESKKKAIQHSIK
ncbi:Fur family transcriptional regulator [Mesoaciditoga sp.]